MRSLRIWINKLSFEGGTEIELAEDSILVIIGPNNSGKSVTLRSIFSLARDKRLAGKCALMSLTNHKQTTVEELRELLKPAFSLETNQYNIEGHTFRDHHLEGYWTNDTIPGFIANLAVTELSTGGRLANGPGQAYERRDKFSFRHPIQMMHADEDVELKVSEILRRAFKKDLVLYRGMSSQIPVYLGNRPDFEDGEHPTKPSYLDKVEALDRLEGQGDGIVSFVNIVMHIVTGSRPIALVDEPEAFLHPPQAKIIGETIASNPAVRQVMLATHSTDILQGLLSGDVSRISVVRLARHRKVPPAAHLRNEQVVRLWTDPILRFSKALDGLFHDGVVIAEADNDCRFYEAMMSVSVPASERPDIHYTYSGGKDRLPTIIDAFMELKIPVATVADFDVLNDEGVLSRIVAAHKGDWSAIKPDWQTVKSAVEGAENTFLGVKKFSEAIRSELEKIKAEQVVPRASISAIKKLARNATPWDNAKEKGLGAIGRGDATNACKRLLEALKAIGIFVVPVGAMEGFDVTVGNKGSRWVPIVLGKDIERDSDLAGARAFVREIATFLAG